MTTTYWLGLGANLGDRRAALVAMLRGLRELGATVTAASGTYATAPRDREDQPRFLNAAARIDTALGPSALLTSIKRLEEAIGRVPGVRFGPRAIDCDILLWSGGRYDTPELTIPHPRLRERRFALVPLLDLNRELTLPDGTRIADVAAAIDPAEQDVTVHDPRPLLASRRSSLASGRQLQ
ncbi:MAG: 2-amino-4-hydroxy-6-hydroxymethyldihydropteridine diphosphokinase [Actinobacteria bacterium]|nr:2-amino-4-hydroxy-6-hydroxymethyldihydropteridine diphosphokinase [Actinomycetota bacterium]